MIRRAMLRAMIGAPIAMRGDGLKRPVNAPPAGAAVPGMQPGASSPLLAANRVVIYGPNDAVFIYNGQPAFGNLQSSLTSLTFAGTDGRGNAVLPGNAFYQKSSLTGNYVAQRVSALSTSYYTAATMAGPWVAIPGAGLGFSDVNGSLGWSGPFTATGGTPANPTVISTDLWNNVTPPSPWSGTLRYRLMPTRSVRIQSNLAGSSYMTTNGQILMTLPPGYQPAVQAQIPVAVFDGSSSAADTYHVFVTTGGQVTLNGVSTSGTNQCGFLADIPLD